MGTTCLPVRIKGVVIGEMTKNKTIHFGEKQYRKNVTSKHNLEKIILDYNKQIAELNKIVFGKNIRICDLEQRLRD
jgi:hypothetical protein